MSKIEVYVPADTKEPVTRLVLEYGIGCVLLKSVNEDGSLRKYLASITPEGIRLLASAGDAGIETGLDGRIVVLR